MPQLGGVEFFQARIAYSVHPCSVVRSDTSSKACVSSMVNQSTAFLSPEK